MILYYNDDNDTVLSPINWTEPTTPQTFQTRLTFKCSKAFVCHNQFFFCILEHKYLKAPNS